MPRPSRHRTGVTLVELLVVLLLLGIAGALVVPAWRASVGLSDTEGRDPFVSARALAARRGESMRVDISPLGAWRVGAQRDTTAAILAMGAPDATGASGTGDIAGAWVVSPLGLCLPIPGGAAPHAAVVWNPVQCAPAR